MGVGMTPIKGGERVGSSLVSSESMVRVSSARFSVRHTVSDGCGECCNLTLPHLYMGL
jgi:hypothetical protein